ncbi:hypothetical protein L5515_019685 [Caenorhabditis briggsae]|uniref:Uncharacterized protein n=1 Tax=Caenorhabditis briggsae TaxID=6238 RepID=A0AAE9FJU9_CAEBR|nr:hypothetical protein L5515_019685 [Caenorhabditis briggsae]
MIPSITQVQEKIVELNWLAGSISKHMASQYRARQSKKSSGLRWKEGKIQDTYDPSTFQPDIRRPCIEGVQEKCLALFKHGESMFSQNN